ncbi:hypothetical protein K435DRAFT_195421 [Dendrothele bispora CBS 962.96]|uniref:Uncharacterized protein n=1 Tax=Dendrothele bispora (strain CBS 962.96) TaxID=1314807 RepID=A0A4S8LUK2_DENBC|nr:hypothetical protein K435DRAFT_195421 [Dendrothele bispora CBS 962.96]
MSAELAFLQDISLISPQPEPHAFSHNPKQPVSLPVIVTNTFPATALTIIGKFKNLQYRVVNGETQSFKDMFRSMDRKMGISIHINKWRVTGQVMGRTYESINETGWTR